ncbi:hypothetical protein C0J52_06722 [Blattella germanica]|nr:hypothetical protein C0J52_06722 [Blattella germanica]
MKGIPVVNLKLKAEPFWKPVDLTEFSQYREYVAHPMDLSLLERNIKKRIYGSTEAFVADTKWMLHNCIIFNTYQSRLTGVAKMLVKICRQEMAEIENCPDCYLNAHTRKDSWFIEVCEVEQHTKKLREKFGMFHHAPFRTNFEPGQEAEHLKMLLPNYNPDNDGPPSSKRNKLHGGGYAVRTYQRSNHNERETQKQRSYSKPEASENIDDLMDGDKLKKYEKKKTENENTEGDYSRRISRPRKRTASGSRASRQSSLSSECSQESDITTQNKKNNSAKSASLIEWSRFEESAVHISVGVEGLASDEDKQSVTSDDRKLTRDGDDSGDAVLPADCSKSIEGESENKTGNNVENTKSTNSQVVNKSFSGQSIVDKLQEKLLRLEGSSDSDDAMSCKNGVEDKTKKTEDDSKNPEDCETQNKPTVSSKKMSETDIESIPEKTSVKTKEKQESSITDKETTERERSKSPIVNKFPHKSDPKRYGKQYFPKVVLYNMVLPKDLNLSKENNSEEDSATKQNSDKIVEQKDSVQEPICKSSSLVSETASRLQNLLKNRIEESENHMTDTSHDSESSSSQDNESDSIKLSLDEGEPDIEEEKDAETNSTSSESMSDSGEGSVELDSLKHTPKHGYNRSGINGNPLEDNENPLDDDEKSNNSDNVTVGTVVEMEVNNEKSGNSDKVAIETVTEKEKNEDEVNTSTTSIESTEDPNEEPKSMNKINEEENSGVDIGLEPKTKEVTADESPPDKEVPDEDVPSTELLNTKSSKEILTDDQKSEKGKQGVDEEVDREVSDKKDLASDVTPTGFDDTVTEGVDKNACDGNGKDISNKDDEVDDAESDKLLNLEHPEDNIENVKDVSVEGAETTDNINRARTLTVNNGGSDDNADRESEKDGNRESDKDSSMEIDENNRESDKDSNRKSYMGSNRESDKNSISESDKNIISESNKDSNRESDKDCNKESDKGSNKESDKDSSMEIDENNRETDKGSNRESDKDNSMEIDENNKENDKNSNRENEVINSESNNKSSDPDVVLESERERKSNKGNGKESDNVSMLTREDIKTEISVDADKEHDQHSNTENDAEIQKDSSENDKQIANEDDSNDEDSSETNSSNTAKYRSKSNKSLDKKIKELSDGSRTEATIGSGVTITPADSTKTAKSKSAGSPATKEGDSTIEKHIKEEPVDPDEMLTESSVSSSTLSSTSSTVSSAKSSPAGKQATGANEKKGSDVENGLQTDKGLINKKLTVLEDKERPSSNDSPASMSDKEGIFPALFLDPSITITVINEKQSDSVDEPSVSKTKVSGSDINVNELRASVNLSKDISLTVVGAGYSGSSKEPTTSLDMECVHESDPEDSENSTNTNSSSVPLNIPSTVAGQNAIKQKKAKSSGGSESQLARSRARKSFPVKPTVSGIKVKSHPELVNGIGSLNNKTSVRRNSSGGNSSSSDSRRSSFGTSPHEVLMPEHQPRGENINRNNSTSDNNNNGNNNNGSGMVVLPPLLGNPPVPITNHIQALRAVNGSIGNPPHMTNGVADVRMMPAPSGQSYQIPSNSRISPAGHGSNASGSRYPPLHPRPAGPLLAQLPPTTPAEAGPVSAELDKHKLRLSEYFKVALEETIRDLAELKVPKVKDIAHAMEMEKLKWQHNQEILEIKHNTANHENELKRREAEVHAKRDIQEQRIVGETKKKQWCTLCGKEALFYCCWNTSYCDYPCQQEHWPSHMGTCAQNNNPANADALEGRQRNSPQTPVNIVHPHKPGNAAKQPWLDSVPMFNPATSSASIANRGSSNRTTESPSTSVTDDDYDSNNNFETSQREGSQDSDGRDFIKLDDLLAMGVDVPKMQKKRKRCGKCSGCTTVGNCGQCPPCNNTRTHQVCRRRRCINLMTESVGYASAKKNFINSQQPKMQPGLTNMPNGPNGPNGPSGPNGGKHMAGPPPPGYGAGVMPPQPGHGRGMAGPMGRMPHQYGGMVCPRPGNIQMYDSEMP